MVHVEGIGRREVQAAMAEVARRISVTGAVKSQEPAVYDLAYLLDDDEA